MVTTSADEGGRSRSVRAIALVLAWAVLTGLLIAAGVGVEHSGSVNAFDRHVTSVVVAHRTPALNASMKVVSWLGSWVALVATGIVLIVLVILRRLPIAALVLAIAAWAGENGGVTLTKHIVERERPPQDLRLVSAHGWSWPSGHTAVAFLAFSILALAVGAIAPSSRYRAAAWVLAALAVVAMAFSRVELGVHWTTDVIASMVFVSAWLVVVVALFASDVRPRHNDAEGAAPKRR